MKRLLILLPLLTGCAQFSEMRTEQQDRELANNMAEVGYCHREVCRQIRAETLNTYFSNDLAGWHSFCGND